ncbi:DUF1525 domain-containing protein [Lentisalinibacter orientalis]|uniref:DUF1525 domain-containing protein n=1 Tax=Lentisalinibacter orientalis TaxID=2992241 RepID=UPI00386B93E3
MILWHQLLLWMLFGPLATSFPAEAASSIRMEIFATSDTWIPDPPPEVTLTVYRFDGLRALETQLSAELPADPETATAEAAQRIRRLQADDFGRAEEAARGLSRALELGIDRYPAMVIEEQVILYGLRDPGVALDRYRTWRVETDR